MADDSDRSKPARMVRAVQRLAQQFLDGEAELPPREHAPREISERLGIALNAEGLPFETVVNKLGEIMAATPSSSSPRFFNQLFAGREPVATLAEMLIPLADTSMYTYKVAGAQVLVENEVLRRMLAAVPFPHGEGTFSPGGSLANMTAMVLARNETLHGARDDGVANQRLSLYTSREAHYSIRKSAGILGLGRSSVRDVPTDGAGAMRPDELAQMIARDRDAGWQPFFVNATAGTTVLGVVDPIAAISEITRGHGLWLHVDGALGGSVLLCRKYRDLLDGVAVADSLAWNAHKMLGVPLACSVLLLRRKGLLAAHLGESANYLFQADEEDLNPGTRSLQCGRRSDSLKLWALWQHLGDRGIDARMTRLLDLTREAARMIDADPDLELIAQPQTANVCFSVPGTSSPQLCDYLDRKGILKIGHGTVGDRSAIRLVCVNPDLDKEGVEVVLEEIKEAARCMAAEASRRDPHGAFGPTLGSG